MATPKGNFIAYQPLKPVEYKVGDIYSNMIDGMIKRGEAEKAAEFKRKSDAAKNHSDLMKDWKVDYKTTISPLQDVANESVLYARDKIWEAQQIAQDLNSTEQQKKYAEQVARNAMDSSLQFQTFTADPKLQENYNQNQKTLAEGKAFLGDERINLYQSIQEGSWIKRNNPDGTIEVAFAHGSDKNKNLNFMPISQVKELFATPIEEDKSEEWNTSIITQAKDAANETGRDYYDKRGNLITETKKTFDPKRAKDLVSLQLGFDEKRPIEEQININAIPPKLNHWYYKYTNGEKTIKTKQDYIDAIEASVKEMQAATDPKTVTSIKKTALEIQNDRLRGAKLQQDLQPKPENQPITITPTNSTAPVQIKSDRGVVLGTQNWNVSSFALPKKKGFQTTDNVFGIAEVKDKNGKIQRINLIGAPSATGGFDYTRITAADAIKYAAKVGYTIDEFRAITQNTKPIVTKFNAKLLKAENEDSNVKNPSSKTQIIFKTKEYNQDNEDF